MSYQNHLFIIQLIRQNLHINSDIFYCNQDTLLSQHTVMTICQSIGINIEDYKIDIETIQIIVTKKNNICDKIMLFKEYCDYLCHKYENIEGKEIFDEQYNTIKVIKKSPFPIMMEYFIG